MTGLVPGLLMLAVFALVAGGIYLIRKGRDRKRGMLMLVAAAVFLGNVLILTL
ncbi:hypothetical protein [Sphingomonas sp. SUN039]|uniref:hypothetical protein n=1 Tax=Sphingomonas sp. SUN039 TaxID=2937787 RepID=UPI0021648E58|nr:hypothetical protein [Sphingomonas sp. SUN039]UVO53868.1 hypothetical protein M0209_06940 [Sphingomonas sp. SUN039]